MHEPVLVAVVWNGPRRTACTLYHFLQPPWNVYDLLSPSRPPDERNREAANQYCWGCMNYQINFSALSPYASQFAQGLLTTTILSVVTVVLSFLLAIPGVAARVAPVAWVRGIARVYIDLVRNIPMLVLLYMLYFGLAQSGLRLSSFEAGLAGLVINSTAYVIEIYRGGIEGIKPGQREAAAALGLGPIATWRHIILPQAVRIAFPALGNQVVGIVLGSSLVMVVAASDLTYVAFNVGADTFRYFETFIIAGLAYLVVVQTITLAWRLLGHVLLPVYRT